MNFFRRLKIKYGIAHPLCMFSLLACFCLCTITILYALIFYQTAGIATAGYTPDITFGSDIELYSDILQLADVLFDAVLKSYSQVVAIGMEPLLAVLVQGSGGLVNAMLGLPLNIDATIFSVPFVMILTLSVCVLGKLLQCFECTRSFSMLTFGEIERIFGYALMVYFSCQNVIRVIYVCEKHKGTISRLFVNIPFEIAVGLVVFSICVITSFAAILTFYIIKTSMLGLQIVQLSIAFFPFTSLLFETLRSCFVIGIAILNLLFPRVGFAFNCVAFVIGCIFLTKTSSSVEYFRVIYLESLFFPYYKFRGEKKHLYRDVPYEIQKKCQNLENIIIPVFSMDKFTIKGTEVSNHEMWWMELSENTVFFYRQKPLSKKVDIISYESGEKKWYFKDNWKCLELFDLNGPEENIIRLFRKPEREISFAVSREYEAVFEAITGDMHAVDYNALKAKLTAERKRYIEKTNHEFYTAIQ